jgi:hypothetical protein
MPARDAMEFINEQDEATLHRFVERLEFRGRDPTFVGYRDAYVAKMDLAPSARVLDDADVGHSSFFLGAAESYAPLVVGSQLVPAAEVDAWLDELRHASEAGVFFAACNYDAYIARR